MGTDIFTKALSRDKHYHCMFQLGMSLISPNSNPTQEPKI